MLIALSKSDLSHMTPNERALVRCERALELKDRGDYTGAQSAMGSLWKRIGEHPNTEGLHPSVAAEVLFCAGILTRFIGARDEIKEANEWARDLLTESITYHESVQDAFKIAAVRAELAWCYWRAGALDEARIWFTEALKKLTTEGNTRANAVFGLSVVEWSASRFKESSRILNESASLFKQITNHSLKGFYHMQVALVLRGLAPPGEKTATEFRRILDEYEEADRHFTLARSTIFRAHVKNNISYVLREVGRFKEAHEYLDHAGRLTVSAKDKVRTAQVDESRAQLFIAEAKYVEAESAARHAVKTFKKSGHQLFLSEALTTHGIALARLGSTGRAQLTLQEAIEVAHQAGSLNRAGIAALTMIEEIHDLSADTLSSAYDQASEWLEEAQSHTLLLRFKAAGKKLAARLRTDAKSSPTETLLKRRKCKDELLQIEEARIRKALVEANGSVTRAAPLVGVTYPGLIYIIKSRHPHLLDERTPVRHRKRRQ